MTFRRILAVSLFAIFVTGGTAVPVSLDTASFEIGLKTALAKKKDKKAKKGKKAKKDKKAKRDKREKREKNCTRDQPCNDANENRKDEGKGKGKRNRINSLRPGRNPPYFVRFLHILKSCNC